MGADYKPSRIPPLLSGTHENLDVAGVAEYLSVSGIDFRDVVINNHELVAPYAGVISNMTSYLNNPPGAGATRTFTLYITGAPTALTTTHGAADNIQFDDVNIVAVQRGDLLVWHSDGGIAGPAASRVKISCLYKRTG